MRLDDLLQGSLVEQRVSKTSRSHKGVFVMRKNGGKETRKDRFAAEKSKKSLDRKSPVTLRMGNGRKDRGKFFVEGRIRRRKILLLEERK